MCRGNAEEIPADVEAQHAIFRRPAFCNIETCLSGSDIYYGIPPKYNISTLHWVLRRCKSIGANSFDLFAPEQNSKMKDFVSRTTDDANQGKNV